MSKEVQELIAGDSGAIIFLATGEDVSTASQLLIKYVMPGGGSGQWPATVAQEADDKGRLRDGMKYVTQPGDIPATEFGTWIIRSYIDSISFNGHGDRVELEVLDPAS